MKSIKHFSYLYDYVLKGLRNVLSIEGDILGARWSGKTKSVLIVLASLLFFNNTIEFRSKRIRINWIRLEVAASKENFQEFLDTLMDMNLYHKVYINRQDRFIKYKDVEVRFIGYESSKNKDVKKLGIKRSANIDLMINVFEEIFEFSRRNDIDKIEQALGEAKSMIKFKLSNPWDESHWWLKSISKELDDSGQIFDEDLMNKQGYNFFKIRGNNFIDWTNHRVNNYLSEVGHQKLLDTWNYDPTQARIVELGAMGVVEGGIYTRAIMNVNKYIPQTYKPVYWFIGVDVGITRDATVFLLLSRNIDHTEWGIHQEYYHSHTEQEYVINGKDRGYRPKSNVDYARDLVNIGKEWSLQVRQKLYAEVDYTSNLYQMVQEFSSIDKVKDLIDARPCQKPPISIRIDMTLMMMNKKGLHIDFKRCLKIVEEFKGAKYPDKSEERLKNKRNAYDIIRLDGRDHSINAFENGMGTKFFTIRDLPYAKLYDRKMWKQKVG